MIAMPEEFARAPSTARGRPGRLAERRPRLDVSSQRAEVDVQVRVVRPGHKVFFATSCALLPLGS
ncbi:hypothetical protein [Streptomyces sp. NPDC029004]|uniref:hypothetical protein n=1 Tax=Streptomyces sp. NPDC029004 TaxID=3154490 RepID=UPI003406D961